MAEAAVASPAADEAVSAELPPLRAFWAAFRENRGAVLGLAVVMSFAAWFGYVVLLRPLFGQLAARRRSA